MGSVIYIRKLIATTPIPYYYGTGGIATGNGTSISVPYPSTIESGDLLLMHVLSKSTTLGINAPSGWSTTWSGSIGSTVTYINYRKFATGSESGNITVTFTTSEQRGIIIYLYKHANTYLNHGINIINNTNTGATPGFAGVSEQLQSSSLYVNVQTNISLSGSGWVENSNLSTPDNGGFTFVNATYAFSSSETAPTVTYTLDANCYGAIHRALMKHTP